MGKLIVGWIIAMLFLFYHVFITCIVFDFIFSHGFSTIVSYTLSTLYVLGMYVVGMAELTAISRKD